MVLVVGGGRGGKVVGGGIGAAVVVDVVGGSAGTVVRVVREPAETRVDPLEASLTASTETTPARATIVAIIPINRARRIPIGQYSPRRFR